MGCPTYWHSAFRSILLFHKITRLASLLAESKSYFITLKAWNRILPTFQHVWNFSFSLCFGNLIFRLFLLGFNSFRLFLWTFNSFQEVLLSFVPITRVFSCQKICKKRSPLVFTLKLNLILPASRVLIFSVKSNLI